MRLITLIIALVIIIFTVSFYFKSTKKALQGAVDKGPRIDEAALVGGHGQQRPGEAECAAHSHLEGSPEDESANTLDTNTFDPRGHFGRRICAGNP